MAIQIHYEIKCNFYLSCAWKSVINHHKVGMGTSYAYIYMQTQIHTHIYINVYKYIHTHTTHTLRTPPDDSEGMKKATQKRLIFEMRRKGTISHIRQQTSYN